jgi:hypothetical protein
VILQPVFLVATHRVEAKRATPLRHATRATLGGRWRRCCVAKLSRSAHASQHAPDLRPAARAQVEIAALSGRSSLGRLPHGWCVAASDEQAPARAVLGVGTRDNGPTGARRGSQPSPKRILAAPLHGEHTRAEPRESGMTPRSTMRTLALGSGGGVALAVVALLLCGVAACAIFGRLRRPRGTDPTMTNPTGAPAPLVGDGLDFKAPPDPADG